MFATSKDVQIFLAICDEAQTPLSYKASLLAKREDWGSLARMKIRPADYLSASLYLRDAQVLAFLKKHPAMPVGVDPKRAAVDSFFQAEKKCYITNERLSPLLHDQFAYGERLAGFLRLWRKEIKNVLRGVPPLERLEPRFGPGSTYGNRGNLITIPDKFDSNFSATSRAFDAFAPIWDKTAWSRYAAAGLEGIVASCDDDFRAQTQLPSNASPYAPRDLEIVRGNRFTTVPKTALTDRGICIEPSVNVFYQLAVGKLLTSRLGRAYGWNKEDIQARHRDLARVGSLTGANATIDLSSASDTICSNLVRLLLPRRWHELLCQLRSGYTLINGHWVRLEKFSSMGNGYTFELETLIFYTLAVVVSRLTNTQANDFDFGHVVSCFGDDIIVPRSVAGELIAALEFFGFSVNEDKTFVDGPFRESCGGDYFHGFNVRPHYLKGELIEPSDYIACANGLLRYHSRYSDCGGSDSHRRFSRVIALNAVPRQIRRCRGPESLGDVVIHDEPHTWDLVVRNSIRYVRVWRPVVNRKIDIERHFRPGVVLASALYLAGSESPINANYQTGNGNNTRAGLVPRISGSYVSGYRFGRAPYS